MNSETREVLEGRWVGSWEAVQEVEDILKCYGVSTAMSAGQIIAQMAASGYLPTITDEMVIGGTEEALDNNQPDPFSFSELIGEWRQVPVTFWRAIGQLGVGDRGFVLKAIFNFKMSAGSVITSREQVPTQTPLSELIAEGSLNSIMARNVLFYFDALSVADCFVNGDLDEGALYDYKNLDLSLTARPSKLPTDAYAEPDKAPGRAGGKNGEPIALLTIRLMRLTPGELATYTADAAGSELAQLFELLGQRGRSPANCKKDAAGVLRAVRSAHGTARSH